MRRTSPIYALSLTVVVFLPSISDVACARAGFIRVDSTGSLTIQPTSESDNQPVPNGSVKEHPVDSFPVFVFQTDAPNHVPSPFNGLPGNGKPVPFPVPAPQDSQGTTGEGTSLGHGASGQQAGLFGLAEIIYPELFVLLRFTNDVFHPPPFAVSLFRPPRVV